MKDDNKQQVGDTVKEMTDNPKAAMKKDYEQTKEDVKNIEDSAKEKFSSDKNKEE